MTPEQEDALVEQSLRESMAQSEASVRFSLGDAIRLAIRAAVAQERERCAKVCEAIEDEFWRLYKEGPREHRANQHTEGVSDGANTCAAAIRRG